MSAGAASGEADSKRRAAVIDLLRGVAILAMVVYHFSWDLAFHRLIDVDVGLDPGWKFFARSIATTFLLLVGFNLVIAARNGFRWRPYLRRLAIIAGAAALVSLGTYWFLPDDFVFFGILHEIAAASVLALPFMAGPVWLSAIAAVVFIAGPWFLTSPFFDTAPWLWLGLAATVPPTVDYVPIFPWFGVVLLGTVAARLVLASGNDWMWRWQPHDPVSRTLMLAGRWSLPIYLIHQPLLLGVLTVVGPLIGPSPAALAHSFTGQCEASCADRGYDQPLCSGYCGCVLDGLAGDKDLLTAALGGTMTAEQRAAWQVDIGECSARALAPPADGRDGGG